MFKAPASSYSAVGEGVQTPFRSSLLQNQPQDAAPAAQVEMGQPDSLVDDEFFFEGRSTIGPAPELRSTGSSACDDAEESRVDAGMCRRCGRGNVLSSNKVARHSRYYNNNTVGSTVLVQWMSDLLYTGSYGRAV